MSEVVIKPYEFTKLATQELTKIQEDENLMIKLRQGDSDTWKKLFQNITEHNYTFGTFLKRYLSQKHSKDFDSFTDDMLMQKIKTAFFDNQMDNVGTLKPGGKTTLTQCLSKSLHRPVTAIKRSTCFLFFFGLGMNEQEASNMLKKEFCQADFNIRDPKEMIYYYCLKHQQSYKDMLDWLHK